MASLQELNTRATKWLSKRQAIQEQRDEEQATLNQTREDAKDIKAAIAVLQYVLAETSKEKENQTAALGTLALREAFPDYELSLLLEPGVYRGHQGVTFKIRDEKTGVEGDPLESNGGGPASLLGLILQVISVVRQPGMARVLILDEPMPQVSAGFQDDVGKLMRKLCEPEPRGLGFQMLVVTHMEAIANYAHKRYRATKSPDGKQVVLTEEKVEDE